MADSDNSTAVPVVTRRGALAWGLRSAVGGSARIPVQAGAPSNNILDLVACSADPIVGIWLDWALDADAKDWAREDRADVAFERLVTLGARSVAGIAAKLDAVLSEGEVWEDTSLFPWPHIRSALDDLMRLFGEAMPADLIEVHRLRQSGVARRPRRREGCCFQIPRDFPTDEEIG